MTKKVVLPQSKLDLPITYIEFVKLGQSVKGTNAFPTVFSKN